MKLVLDATVERMKKAKSIEKTAQNDNINKQKINECTNERTNKITFESRYTFICDAVTCVI